MSGTKAVKKPIAIEFFTFEEIVNYGKAVAPETINGDRAWSFQLFGYNITHENDSCYIIPTSEGSHNFTPDDVLIKGIKGELYPCKKDIFELSYNINKETTFLDRLIQEEKELGEKLIGLVQFLNKNDVNKIIGEYQFSLLNIQQANMSAYRQILIARINNLKE